MGGTVSGGASGTVSGAGIGIDRRSRIASSSQLRDAIRDRIEHGGLLPGDRLPPVRALAEQLDLAPNTVAKAYRELERYGWLEGRGRAGTYVTDRLPSRPAAPLEALEAAAGAYLERARALGFDAPAAASALRKAARER